MATSYLTAIILLLTVTSQILQRYHMALFFPPPILDMSIIHKVTISISLENSYLMVGDSGIHEATHAYIVLA